MRHISAFPHQSAILDQEGQIMNIAIDIDDTLTESFEYFQPYVAEYFNADIDELRRKNISYSNLPDEWKAHEIDFCKTYYDRIVEDTPFKTNAAPSIKKLKEMEASPLFFCLMLINIYTFCLYYIIFYIPIYKYFIIYI